MKNEQVPPVKVEKFHLGIYVIITKGDSVLLVKKSRGPYRGKWDLPGGSPLHGESILQTLHREVFEETGVRLDCVDHHKNIAFTVEYKEGGKRISLHHICLVYMARDSFDTSGFIEKVEKEDVSECAWIKRSQLLGKFPTSKVFRYSYGGETPLNENREKSHKKVKNRQKNGPNGFYTFGRLEKTKGTKKE